MYYKAIEGLIQFLRVTKSLYRKIMFATTNKVTDLKKTEEVGFEPTIRLSRIHAFQAGSIGHSDTPPMKTDDS